MSFFQRRDASQTLAAKECGSSLFDGLKIMEHTDIVEKHMNKYPVVFLTLKNVEFAAYEDSIGAILE